MKRSELLKLIEEFTSTLSDDSHGTDSGLSPYQEAADQMGAFIAYLDSKQEESVPKYFIQLMGKEPQRLTKEEYYEVGSTFGNMYKTYHPESFDVRSGKLVGTVVPGTAPVFEEEEADEAG